MSVLCVVMCLWLICLFEDFLLLFLFLNFFHCVWTMSQCQWWWDFLCLKHPHQWIQTFHLFCTKESYIFYFTHPFLQKHPHQFIYFTHLFNKIFILLQFFIILSLTTSLFHRPNLKPIQSPISPSPPLSLTDPIHLSLTFPSTKQ